jgi:nicotinate phosphoribosyltransferase
LTREEITEIEPLQVDVLVEGKLVYDPPHLEVLRRQRQADVARLDPGVLRLVNPHVYHVSLTQRLWELKQELIESAMEKSR